jgi:serine/threonine-protein kinase
MFFRGQIVGKYKIMSTLGSGGFGTVYLAEDTWIDKKVALKVPHKQNLDFSEMLKEPRLLASMSHPNIVTVLTAEKQDGVFFIVMEYVAGETLENVIGREGALEMTRALDFTCQICNAVDHAHRQNVLHRDLRPANIMIADNGLVKVADFGTSRFLELAAVGTTVIGSPPYMAPEQFMEGAPQRRLLDRRHDGPDVDGHSAHGRTPSPADLELCAATGPRAQAEARQQRYRAQGDGA